MTKIILSGCESDGDYDTLLSTGCRNVLMTFMHLRKKKTNVVAARKKAHPDLSIFIDSGGFTLLNNDEYLGDLKAVQEYAKQYIAWLYENHEHIACAANLDLYRDYPEASAEWDKEFKELERKTGLPIVYVFHPLPNGPTWEQMCVKHRYIGYSSDTVDAPQCNTSSMLALARRHGVKVHGFSITDTESLGRDLFYSADSTTWIMGAKFGRTMAWDGTQFRQFNTDTKERRQQFRQHFINKGINWSLIEADGRGERSPEIRAETLRMNATAWMDYQEYVFKRVEPRAWWNKIDELRKQIPKIKTASSAEILDFYKRLGYASGCTETEDLRNEMYKLFAFSRRDEKAIAGYDDEEVKEFAGYFGDEDEAARCSDHDMLVDIARRGALNILVPLGSSEPQLRTTPDDVKPSKPVVKEREEPLENLNVPEAVEIELPEPTESVKTEAKTETEKPMPEPVSTALIPVEPVKANDGHSAEKPAYPAFIDQLPDESKRLRTRLLVDALLSYNKHKRQLNSMKLMRKPAKEMHNVKTHMNAAKQEVSFMRTSLGKEISAQVDKWMEENVGREITLVPPERTYHISKENAAEIGKLGGAPPNNLNALRHGIYSKKLPKLACDTCPIAATCYMHKPGRVCAFDSEFKKLQVTDVDSAINVMTSIVNTDLERLQRQLVFETAQGGVANNDTSSLQSATFQRIDRVRELMKSKQNQENGAANVTAKLGGEVVTVTKQETVSGPAAAMAEMLAKLAPTTSNRPTESDADRAKVADAEIIKERDVPRE